MKYKMYNYPNWKNGNGHRLKNFRRSRIVFGNRIGSLFLYVSLLALLALKASNSEDFHFIGRCESGQNRECDKCEGDCDNDDGCKGNLKCCKNDAYDTTPGCSKGDNDNEKTRNADYCYDNGDDGACGSSDDDDDDDDDDNDDDDDDDDSGSR